MRQSLGGVKVRASKEGIGQPLNSSAAHQIVFLTTTLRRPNDEILVRHVSCRLCHQGDVSGVMCRPKNEARYLKPRDDCGPMLAFHRILRVNGKKLQEKKNGSRGPGEALRVENHDDRRCPRRGEYKSI